MKSSRTTNLIVVAVCLALASLALGQRIARPVLTMVLDDAGGIRPLIGIPGAASVGAKVDLGFPVEQIASSPDAAYLLATASAYREAVLMRQSADGLVVGPVTLPCAWHEYIVRRCTPVAEIDRIALSPTGSAAALFSESTGRVYVLPDPAHNASNVVEVDITGYGSVTNIAIADGGQTLAFAADGGVFYAGPNQAPTLRAALSQPGAIQFLRHTTDVVVADDQNLSINLINSEGVFQLLSLADAGMSRAVGIASSHDNSIVFVADAKGLVSTIASDGSVIPPVNCKCAVTGLHATRLNSVFRLTNFTGAPIVMFDARTSTPRTVFAPVSSR